MSKQLFIPITISLISVLSLIFIPKAQRRRAFIAFNIFQACSWIVVLTLVQGHQMTFPIREFPKASRANFLSQFMYYPIGFVWFVILYPEKGTNFKKAVHYFLFVSIPIVYIYLTIRFTDLRKPVSNNMYSMFILNYTSFFLEYRLCHLFVKWFFKEKNYISNVQNRILKKKG